MATWSLSFLLILTLITGTESIIKISKVSVKVGTSISIPCLYSKQYKGNVKYLCKGYHWHNCQYQIKTNSQQKPAKYLISDDKSQTIFNVTIKQPRAEDDFYWCAVEINGGADVKDYFHLSFTQDTPSLYVDNQKVTGFIGETTTITCHHTASGEIQWCKLGSTCFKGGSGSIDGTKVTIGGKNSHSFTVTMSELRPESSGWYYCVKGDFQMPIYLTVTIRPTVVEPTTVAATESATAKEEQKTKEHRSFPALLSLMIPLGLLMLVVIVALLILFRTKRAKIRDSSGNLNLKEGDVTYSEVSFKKNKTTRALPVESDADVTYSSVIIVKPQGGKQAKAKDENVTYSTVSHHKRNV